MTENEFLLTSLLDCSRQDLYLHPRVLSPEERFQYDEMKRRRQKGEPLQYILGHCDFMGIALSIDQRALIPRPETELLVEQAIKEIFASEKSSSMKILDLGVGSGNISIALAKNIENCSITSVDISSEAIELARYNAQVNFVDDKITFIHQDMVPFLHEHSQECQYDLIVSNPPYIKTGEMDLLPQDVQKEPKIALDGGQDGLDFYRHIFQRSHEILMPNGLLICEFGDGQAEGIEEICCRFSGYGNLTFYKDYTETDRFFIVRKKY